MNIIMRNIQWAPSHLTGMFPTCYKHDSLLFYVLIHTSVRSKQVWIRLNMILLTTLPHISFQNACIPPEDLQMLTSSQENASQIYLCEGSFKRFQQYLHTTGRFLLVYMTALLAWELQHILSLSWCTMSRPLVKSPTTSASKGSKHWSPAGQEIIPFFLLTNAHTWSHCRNLDKF